MEKAKVIGTLSLKGGVGKTTIATNLAGAFAARGEDVILIDFDPNRSAARWGVRRKAKLENPLFVVATEQSASIVMNTQKFSMILFDTKGRPDAEEIADLVEHWDSIVIPTKLDGFSIEVTSHTYKLLPEEARSKALIIGMDVPKQSSVTFLSLFKEMRAHGMPIYEKPVSSLQVFKTAAAEGLCVNEVRDPLAGRAWDEIAQVADAIAEICGMKQGVLNG
ncbi:MAG TPA: ParA family protein [Leptolyngbyaceae cyanobacterium]